MKTKLLKKWRREACNRIGVFKHESGRYCIVFDKSMWGDVGYMYNNNPNSQGLQYVTMDISDISEAIERCDAVRREYILREARKDFNKKKRGSPDRVY